jgi:uncharacterized protein Usg
MPHRFDVGELLGVRWFMSSLALQLRAYRLTTAEILYHLPDHPDLLQSYVWQDLDLAPSFPVLRKFLDFWSHNLEGKLHSVRVGHAVVISPPRFQHVDSLIVH